MFQLNKIVVLDQAAIDEIRSATVCWFKCEEGAPAIHQNSPMSELGDDYADALEVFILASNFDDFGVRKFENPLIGATPYSRYHHGIPECYFDGDEVKKEIEIDFTFEHLKLLANLSIDEHGEPPRKPRFEPKRVYNDHRNAAAGAYCVINEQDYVEYENISDEDWNKYRRLHLETAPALQILLREANVEPGVYVNNLFSGLKKAMEITDYEKCKAFYQKTGRPFSRSTYIGLIQRD